MTSRERLIRTLRGEVPDCMPVAPDFSNMIPARLTGKPFWDIYLYQDPPIWEAYIRCARHFDIDSLMDAYYIPMDYPWETRPDEGWRDQIVYKDAQRIVTQMTRRENGKTEWASTVNVYPRDNPPTFAVPPAKLGLPAVPKRWEAVEGVKPQPAGSAALRRAKELMGDQGLIGVYVAHSAAFFEPDNLLAYIQLEPEAQERIAQERIATAERRFRHIMAMDVKPDFLCVGGSGTLVFQTPQIFRQLAFPAVKRAIDLACEAGMMTHVHSCGPEKELVKVFAEETGLTVIDPLETPPMGDCNLAELKRLYGRTITLKGNLHTTEVMLRGSVADVIAASKRAIDDAAEDGRFILATGDQCGRDTPDDNIRAMIETARTYGRYA